MSKPRIALVVTGGTIDTLGEGRLDLFEYARHQRWLTPLELLASVPELQEMADIMLVEMPRFGVSTFSISDWVALHAAISSAVDAGAEGVVVTQGSNYVEENAYFLSLTLKTASPVVLTAAMRPASGMGSDGAMNLVDAVRVALDPASHAHGVTVVMNGRIHAARDVTKGHTQALEAFHSLQSGPLGELLPNGSVVYFRHGLKLHTLDTPFHITSFSVADWPRVEILAACYGGDGALAEAALQLGARGLVCVGFGAGRPGPGLHGVLCKAATNGIPVVLSARANGRVTAYRALNKQGFIAANDLTPWKARILLQLALVHANDVRSFQDIFDGF